MDLLTATLAFMATFWIARVLGSNFVGTYALLVTIVVCTWRLRLAQSSWRELGFRRPASWPRTLLWALALLLSSELFAYLLILPLARAAHWPPPDVSRFAVVRGHWPVLLAWLLLAWTSAAIAEELVFRGFMISRLQRLFGASRVATVLVVLVQAACFGVAHFYLGPQGVANAALIGCLYGTAYFATDRNLPALMLAHGATDTLSLIAIYAGAGA